AAESGGRSVDAERELRPARRERAALVVDRGGALRFYVAELDLRRVVSCLAEVRPARGGARAGGGDRGRVALRVGSGPVPDVGGAAHGCPSAALVRAIAQDLVGHRARTGIDASKRDRRAGHRAAHLVERAGRAAATSKIEVTDVDGRVVQRAIVL